MTKKETVERFEPYTDEGNRYNYGQMEQLEDGDWVLYEDYRIQATRIEALEVQIKQLGDMYHKRGNDLAWAQRQAKKARKDALREAAIVADEWYMNIGKGTPSGEILSLIDKENT